MYTVTNGALLELVFNYEVSGQQCLNILHFELEDTSSPIVGGTALSLICQDFVEGPTPNYLETFAATQSDTVEYRSVSAQWIWPTRYRKFKRVLDATGDLVDSNAPSVNAITITKANDFTGPHNIGALHLAGFPKAWLLSDGRIDPAAIGDQLDNLANKLIENWIPSLLGGTLKPVIFNRVSPSDSRPFTEWEIQETARAMQRRVVGRGI